MQHEETNESKPVTIAGVLCARDGILSPTSASEICMGMDTNKEAFLSAYIQRFPEAANLPPDVVWWGAEVVCRTSDGKPKRLDRLGHSKTTTLVYAVEVQAGKGDADHINRAIFYVKGIKRRLEEIVEEAKNRQGDTVNGAELSEENVVGVLVCEQKPEEYDADIADSNNLTVVSVSFVKTSEGIATLLPQIEVGGVKTMQEPSDSSVDSSSLEWHKECADKFFSDAGGLQTFHREFRETPGGCAITAPIRFVDGKRRTVGFWCENAKRRMRDKQVHLYGIPLEVFEAWDDLGVNYKVGGGTKVVRLYEPGRVERNNQGFHIQLDDENRTVLWAKHFADAVRWVNEKNPAPVGD